MKRTVILVGLALLLSGCATAVWTKPGATQQDLAKDSYDCEKDMRQSGYYGTGIIGAMNADGFEDRCMVAHGWRLQSTAQSLRTDNDTSAPSTSLSGGQNELARTIALGAVQRGDCKTAKEFVLTTRDPDLAREIWGMCPQ